MTLLNSFFFIANVIGGLGIFLYGLKLLSTSIRKLSSDKLKSFFDFLTRNKLMGITFGAIITSLLQSSSATTVIMIGFANAGIISLAQGISIIFGANIGTTITAQIIAFKASEIALPLIGVGALFYFFGKRKVKINIGEVLIGLGLLFYGLKLMGAFLKPLKDAPIFMDIMVNFGQYPLLGIIVGMLITVLIQSSSATTGLIITLGAMGLIDFKSAFCLELGSNIGTTITAQLASYGTNKTARRAAWAHTLFNVIGSFYMWLLLYIKLDGQPIFLRFIDVMTPGDVFLGENLPRHFANAHTLFNIMNVIVLFPFMNHLARLTKKIIPGEDIVIDESSRFLDARMATTPGVALHQAVKEMLRMLSISKDMTKHVYKAMYREKKQAIPMVEECERTLNVLQDKILAFLGDVNHRLETSEQISTANAVIHTVEFLERIGDHNVALIAQYEEIAESKESYPAEFVQKSKILFHHIQDMFQLLITGFDQIDDDLIEKINSINEQFSELEQEIQTQQFSDIRNKTLSTKLAINMMEIMGHFERIRSHLTRISKQAPHVVLDMVD